MDICIVEGPDTQLNKQVETLLNHMYNNDPAFQYKLDKAVMEPMMKWLLYGEEPNGKA